MGDFKRNSSRFSRGSSEGAPAGAQRSSSGTSRSSAPREGASQGGSYQRRSGSGASNAEGGSFPFTRIASLTVPKSANDETRDFVEGELRGSNLSLTAKVYLGKGDNELTLKSGDMLLVSFKINDKDKDFVVGSVSVKN